MIPHYSVYKTARDCGIQHETLAARFGEVPMEAYRAQYRAETAEWLQSEAVNRVCDEIRSGQ